MKKMFKQFKSALIWFYVIKFRRRLFLIAILLSVALLANYIYADIVEYLTTTDKLHLLIFALLFKWAVIFSSIFGIIYSLLTMFKSSKDDLNSKSKNKASFFAKSSKTQKTKQKQQAPEEQQAQKNQNFNSRELELINKTDLKNQAEFTLNKLENQQTERVEKFDKSKKFDKAEKSGQADKSKQVEQNIKENKSSKIKASLKENLSEREKRLLEKDKLNSKADFLINKKP